MESARPTLSGERIAFERVLFAVQAHRGRAELRGVPRMSAAYLSVLGVHRAQRRRSPRASYCTTVYSVYTHTLHTPH